ncbi:uncharacterized protein A4U43_C08F31700 [Asparagus officinalis]|uniref:uncharacterized protein LOC109851547 n=1 Tax=Asparagus officinalis TaxID=4686 RepID=UPI00098E1C92|nr:uncharacterized protein LOC109851547 [Asparagus officinalis]ONK61605.1 uncharacterized protein A4U43_C08F31700 [Asparagus officinalis]
MGLGESEASIDEGSAVACSICLEIVAGGGDRSTARLRCGHEFHLDCIGSAFNAKGVMQCPNCRKVEKGNWLYANGSRSLPELGIDEWTPDEDLYDPSYSEMTLGVHWCPFSRLAQMPSSFESGSRIVGSFVSSLVPPYLPSPRPDGHGHVRDRYHHQNPRGLHPTVFSGSQQQQGAPNPLPPPGPTPLSLHDQATYYLIPPPPAAASSSRSRHQEADDTSDHFYSWERDQFAPVPFTWRQFPHQNGNGPMMRHSSPQSMETSGYRQNHIGRMRHYF